VIWILGSGKDIAVSTNQLQSRIEFIRCVTEAEVSAWQFIKINEIVDIRFLFCVSKDGVNGVFITAHIGDVFHICKLKQVYESEIVIANTCIWEKSSHKKLLRQLRYINPKIELYFAKQELSIDAMRCFRQSSTLLNVGQFGFQTSLSERELFKNRRQGFAEALRESFTRVSPILLIGE
jgi:hypothetical protein